MPKHISYGDPRDSEIPKQIAHNMLKQESSKDPSIRRKIKKAGWDNDSLTRILIGV